LKKSELRKIIKEELLKETTGKYQLIIEFESSDKLGELVRDMNLNLKDSYFYSDDFPGRVTSTKVKKI
jgi:phosphoserine phosphatase